MEQLTGIDASFVFLESTRTPMHIGGVLFCKAPPGGFHFEDFVRLIESRLGKSKVFRRRLVNVPLGLDAPYWIEDPHFNLDSHVHHMALPSPGGWGELRKLAQHIFAIPLDLRRPLWSMTFVEGLGGINQLPEGSFALIHKMHHSAVDGMGSVDLVSSLFDLSRKVDLRVHEDRWMPDMEPSNITLLANAYMHLLAKPKLAIKTVKAVTAGLWNVGKTMLGRKAGATRRALQGSENPVQCTGQRPAPVWRGLAAAQGDSGTEGRDSRGHGERRGAGDLFRCPAAVSGASQ